MRYHSAPLRTHPPYNAPQVDVARHEFAIEWMKDFEVSGGERVGGRGRSRVCIRGAGACLLPPTAPCIVRRRRSPPLPPPSLPPHHQQAFHAALESDSTYAASLSRSLSMVLDEFYTALKVGA